MLISHFGLASREELLKHLDVDSPLRGATSVREILDYPKWPDIDWFDFDCVARQVAAAHRTGKTVVFIGDRLCFHGSISIQKTLPFGTPDDVRREVGERFETLGPDGGFIFCTAHNIQADTPIANIEALFEAYHDLGRY